MSWDLSSNAKLRPEDRLRNAISSFETSLQPKQREEYDAERRRTGGSAPTARDVMKFIYHIDQQAVSRQRGLTCIGPRFHKVMQAMQQFASIGDILVSGSQSLIACGAWTIVRTSILFLTKHAAALERLSLLFMVVGRSLPRTEQLTALYPRSNELRANTYEFLIIVVDLCKLLAKISNKSAAALLASPLKDSELQKYQTDLENLNQIMRDEVQVLMARNLERVSSLTEAMSKTARRTQMLNARSAVLDMCSTHQYETVWKRLRKSGVASVHRNDDSYRDWRSNAVPELLVVKGKLGCGKSVLMASILSELNAELPATALVCYFFVDPATASSMDSQVILRSILRQILQEVDDDASVAEIVRLRTGRPDTTMFRQLATKIIAGKRQLYLLVDGIDELSAGDTEDLVKELLKMQKALNTQPFGVKLCLSIRMEAKSEVFDLLPSSHLTIDMSAQENPDLQLFIVDELERRLNRNKLKIGDPSLILEIHETLSRGADGMFLWVALQIEALCVQKTDSGVRQALLNLPRTLEEIFSRILRRYSTEEDQLYQERTMRIIAGAERPLTIFEFREAISVEQGQTKWDPDCLVNDVNEILASCGSLVSVDEEDETIHFVHHTVYKYLISQMQNTSESSPQLELDRYMADIVTTYLNYDVFTKQLIKTSTNTELPVTTNMTGAAVIKSSLTPGIAKSLALRFLKHKKHGTVDVSRTIADVLGSAKDTSVQSAFHFHRYASEYACEHLWAYLRTKERLDDNLVKRILAILPSPEAPLNWLIEPRPKSLLYLTLLDMGLREGHLSLEDYKSADVQYKRSRDAWSYLRLEVHPMLCMTDDRGNSGLEWVVHNNEFEVLRNILDRTSLVESSKESSRAKSHLRRALKRTLSKDHLICAELILKAGLPVDWIGDGTQSLLAEFQHQVVLGTREKLAIEWLLSKGATSLTSEDFPTPTPNGILDLLLQKDYDAARIELLRGANLDTTHSGRHLLQACMNRGLYKSVAWLIQHGANTKQSNKSGLTILRDAISRRSSEDTRALIHAGVQRDPCVDETIEFLETQAQPAMEVTELLLTLKEWHIYGRIPWQEFYLSEKEAKKAKEYRDFVPTGEQRRRDSDADSIEDEALDAEKWSFRTTQMREQRSRVLSDFNSTRLTTQRGVFESMSPTVSIEYRG